MGVKAFLLYGIELFLILLTVRRHFCNIVLCYEAYFKFQGDFIKLHGLFIFKDENMCDFKILKFGSTTKLKVK